MLRRPVLRFARVEAWRLLTAPASLLVLALFAGFQIWWVVTWRSACAGPDFAAAFGGYSCTAQGSVSFVLPLVAVLIGGTAAASERFRGADVVLAVRGITGPAYASARMLAGALAAAVGAGLTGVLAILSGLVAHPWRDPRLRDPEVSFIGGPPPNPGTPSSWLWEHAPLANDVAALAIVMVAAAAVAVLGTAVGMWIRYPMIILTVVAGSLMFARYVVPLAGGDFVNPENVLDFEPTSQIHDRLSPAWRPLGHLGLWLGMVAVSVPIAVGGARRAVR